MVEEDALGFATDKSTSKLLYWLVLARQCKHQPEPTGHVHLWHLTCRGKESSWLDAELSGSAFESAFDESEPVPLRFTWIELDGPLSDQDPALENKSI